MWGAGWSKAVQKYMNKPSRDSGTTSREARCVDVQDASIVQNDPPNDPPFSLAQYVRVRKTITQKCIFWIHMKNLVSGFIYRLFTCRLWDQPGQYHRKPSLESTSCGHACDRKTPCWVRAVERGIDQSMRRRNFSNPQLRPNKTNFLSLG